MLIGGNLQAKEYDSKLRENVLIAALPESEKKRLSPWLKRVELDVGHPVTIPGEPISHLYFPIDCVTSTVQEMSDGSTIETGLVGFEGFAGVQVWLRQRSTINTTFVQVPGSALRISTADFIREIRDHVSPLNDLIANYIHAFLVLTSLTAACNRLHSIDQRLCRWLSMIYRRTGPREIPLRHEFLAQMLGVHRPTVSVAANLLQKQKIISYRYGKLTVLDPGGLVNGACECHSIMEEQFANIFKQHQ
jgi:CRP-like cAMP-binding protein